MKLPKRFCKKCNVELIAVDKSKDKQHTRIMEGLAKMGIPCSPFIHFHPKDKGCALNIRSKDKP